MYEITHADGSRYSMNDSHLVTLIWNRQKAPYIQREDRLPRVRVEFYIWVSKRSAATETREGRHAEADGALLSSALRPIR